jgi:cell division protease FtsH
MVGADLANAVNEAALAAARRHAKEVAMVDFETAIDRLQLGLEKRGRVMSPEEKRRVAYHEAGHALTALSVEHADPVHRVSIIPRSIGALGVTLQLPTQERYIMSKQDLLDRICVMLGGRVAEQVVFGEVSTGAQNDLERATETARQMVCRYGMSERLGPVTYGQHSGLRFLLLPDVDQRNFSEETARAIDDEVHALIEAEGRRARALLERRRDSLERVARALLVKETLEREELNALVRAPSPVSEPTPVPAGR